MRALYDPVRHEPLAEFAWSESRAHEAIVAICRDVEAAFAVDRLWPMHPGDNEPGTPDDGILRGLYAGAAGVLHALGRLAEQGLYAPRIDAPAIAGRAVRRELGLTGRARGGLFVTGWIERDPPGHAPVHAIRRHL
jgi:hypothetical protein